MDKYYFVNTNHSNSKITDVIILLEFFVIVFQLLVDISISTNRDQNVHLLVWSQLYARALQEKNEMLAQSLYITFHCIVDVLGEYVDRI